MIQSAVLLPAERTGSSLKHSINRNMRIACFSSDFVDYTIQLANSLSEKGIEVLLLLSNEHLNRYEGQVDYNRESVSKHIYHQPKLYSPKNILLVFGLMRKLLVFNPDVIHFQAFQPWFLLILPWLKLKGHHVVATFHDVITHQGENDFSLLTLIPYSLVTKYFERIFVHGRKLKEQLMEYYPAKKICVIPIGEHNVAPLMKYAKGRKEEANTVLYFGRIFQYKGLEYLIQAEPLIAKGVPGTKIIIAGMGEHFEKYQRLMVNAENFEVHNHFIGSKQAAELFEKCSLVVLPYIDGSQSGVVPVAYAFKKPVVATNVGSIPEIVDNGKTGYVVRARDQVALSEAVIRLLKDDALRRELGDNGYQKLKSDLSWDKIAEKTIRTYREVMVGEGAPEVTR
jgi:alpha-maltose-1-phosphate synthase